MASLFGNLTPAQFLRTRWQRKPHFARGIVPALAHALTREALFVLAQNDELESRLIIRDGKKWEVEHGAFTKRRLAKLPARNWTLLVNGIEAFVPAARALQQKFSFIPYARHDDVMVSYAAPGGGVGAHYDSYDVFLLQGFGRRRWQISAQKDLSLIEDAPLKLLKNFRATRTLIVEAGDLLYLPPRDAHDGVALNECMTWSVGMRAPTPQEFAARFLEFLQDKLNLKGGYHDPELKSQTHPAQLNPLLLKRMRDAAARVKWNAHDVTQCLGMYLTEPRAGVLFKTPALALTQAHFIKQAQNAGLRLALKTRMLFQDNVVFINGENATVTKRDQKYFAQLADTRHVKTPASLSAASWTLLHEWYHAGYIELDN